MGFLVCIFSGLYFMYKLILGNYGKIREVLKKIRNMLLFSVLAVLISAIILIPSYIGVQEGRAYSALGEIRFYRYKF